MMRAISPLSPQRGGVWRVFENLRNGLASYGVELTWLAVGEEAARVAASASPAERLRGEIMAPEAKPGRECALALYEHLRKSRPELLICHALQIESSLARYLPPDIPRILVVHNITPATYRAARAVRDDFHASVAVSVRIREDLIRYFGFDPEWTIAIPNGVDLSEFNGLASAPAAPPLLLLSLGRVEDIAKGVLWLPEILRRVVAEGVDAALTVAGDGPDLERVQRRLEAAGLCSRVRFTGSCPMEEVPGIMSRHHVYVLASRFEGFPLTLAEAMAAGCVPVATRIEGVTETIVEHGRNGFLFPIGNTAAAARHVVDLARDPQLRSRLSAAARARARERFGLDRMAREYWELIRRVWERPRPLPPPLPIESWEIPRGLRPAWWYRLPEPVKNRLRAVRFRLPRELTRLLNVS